MRDCPFCSKGIVLDEISLTKLDEGDFAFTHFCHTPGLHVAVTIYGRTEQEIKDKWNGVYEKPKSESV